MIKPINASDTWQIRHKVMWPEQPLEFVQLQEDDFGLHFGYFIDENLVSIVSCFISNDEIQFRKLATLPEYQGQGIASELLKYIFELARQKNLKRIWLHKLQHYCKINSRCRCHRYCNSHSFALQMC